MATLGFTAPIPLALYVHIPWCARKCPYCDFNSHEARGPVPESAYVDALLADLEQDLPRVWGRRIESVFIGGGTPSLFSAEALDRLLAGLRARLPLRPDTEITLEANPGAVEQGKFAEFREIGINRLSIGVQSFNDEQLQRLGRIHDRRVAFAAAEAAHVAGLDNFNLDLMFGLPEQTVEQALADIANAVALQPAHLSYYQLTIEPNTRFYQSPPTLPDDETISLMQERTQAELARQGYRQYEVSAYARETRRCRHNLNYWEFGDYLGIGAGAHGKLTDPAAGRIHRLWKLKQPRDYLAMAGTPAFLALARAGTPGSEETTRTAWAHKFPWAMPSRRTCRLLPRPETRMANLEMDGLELMLCFQTLAGSCHCPVRGGQLRRIFHPQGWRGYLDFLDR